MSKTYALLFALLLATVGLSGIAAMPVWASDAYGEPFTGSGFVKDDWQLVCDNTLTCRAAGYGDDNETNQTKPASLLLTIRPKEKRIDAQLMLQNMYDEESYPEIAWLAHHGSRVSLYLNNKEYGKVQLDSESLSGTLNTTQIEQLLAQSRQNTKIEFRSGAYSWSVSDKGLTAILLKLDEVQDRVGTPLALVSSKANQRMTPKSAKPIPKIFMPPVYPSDNAKRYLDPAKSQNWRANIYSWITANANEDLDEECSLLNPEHYEWSDDSEWTLTPIDAHHTLASHVCWRGAYNQGEGFWVIDHKKPNKPTLITYSGGSYEDGQIFASQRGRGLGDCVSVNEWTWNGTTFVKSSALTTGMCRMIQLGGAWDLPTYVSEVHVK